MAPSTFSKPTSNARRSHTSNIGYMLYISTISS